MIMRGSRKFCQRGSNFATFIFKVDEGREGPDTTLNGPSSAPSGTPFNFAGVPMMVQH